MFKFDLEYHLDTTALKTAILAALPSTYPNATVTITAVVNISKGPTTFTNPSQGTTGLQSAEVLAQRYELYDADLAPAAGGTAETTLAAVIVPKIVNRYKYGVDNPRLDPGT